MNNQDRAAQVWKGPWKCRNCNAFLSNKEQVHYTQLGRCWGWGEPYDRRNNADWKADREKLIGALGNIAEHKTYEKFGLAYDEYAHVILAEAREEKKLPGFKDIIGLYVDKPKEEHE